jgi:PAS domain S-box-containing protein
MSNIKSKFFERESSLLDCLQQAKNVLSSIDNSELFNSYLESKDKDNTISLFKSLIDTNNNFFQLRYLDILGYEEIRVDKELTTQVSYVTPTEDLQYKGSRDYFKLFSKLSESQIGVSRLDLNQEFGKKTKTSTIRFAKVVYRDGKKQGILILNIHLNPILKKLSNTTLFNIYLIDNNDRFLLYNGQFMPQKSIQSHFSQLDAENITKYDEYIGGSFYSSRLSIDNPQHIKMVLEFKFEQTSTKDKEFKNNLIILAIALMIIYTIIVYYLSKIPDDVIKSLDKTNKELEISIKNEMNIEKQYKTLFETITDGIVIVNSKSEKVYICNKSFEHMVGYKKEIIISNNINIFHNSNESLLTLLKKQKNNEICLLDAIDIVKSDGSKLYVDITISSVVVNDTTYDIVVFRDISEKIKRDKEIKNKDKMLLQQSKMAAMGEMIGMIAHQWRQPLTAIKAIVQSIEFKHRLGKLDAEFIKTQTMQSSELIDYMSHTIDDFRNFFKPNSTKERVSLDSVVSKAIEFTKPQVVQNNIEINYSNRSEKEFYLYPNELMQVVLNIINNAKDIIVEKDLESKYINIEISDFDDYSVVSITDSGGGIPLEYLSKVFEPYFSTKSKNGTGLGLYMSKIIVEDHLGGNLSVSNVKSGAMFDIKVYHNI